MRTIFLALAASLALVACGDKGKAPAAPAAAAADLSEQSPLDKTYRLKSAKELDVDRMFGLFPENLRPTYEAATFDKTLGATVVTNVRFGGPDGKGFTAKRAEFYGADLDKIERLKTATAAAPDAPFDLILAKLRLFDIASADGKTTIGAAELDRLRVREGGIPKEPPASGVAAFFNAFDVAGVYAKDVRSSGAAAEESAAGAGVEFAAADVRLVGLGGGGLKAFLAKDLDYLIRQSPEAIARAGRGLGPAGEALINGPLRHFIAPENQRMKVKALEWRNISFAGLLPYGLKGERPPITARNLIDLGTARLVDAETFIGGKRLSLVPETDISAMAFTWLAPSKVRAVSRGGLYDLTAYVPDTEKEAIAELKSRKLDRVKGDSDFAYDWSADKGGAALSIGFNSVGFADFDVDLALEGLELKKLDAARETGAPRAVADLARLKSFSMVIADEQMLDAFYALSALEAGGTAADMRAATPAMMRLGKLELQRENPRTAGYIDAFAEFLEKGGTLEIRATPASPIPLAALQSAGAGGPDAMAEAVNLTVTRKR